MRKVFLTLMLAALLPAGIQAQQKKEQPKPELVSKIFEVRPGNVERITSALRSLIGGDAVRMDSNLGMIAVHTQPDLMPAVEQVVRRLDTTVPIPNNVEITVYLLEASRGPASAGTITPPDLQPTITQLRNIFAYQSFQLLDAAVLRSRSGQMATMNGVLSFGKDESVQYGIRLRPTVQATESTRSIRIDDLLFSTEVPVGPPPPEPGQVVPLGGRRRVQARITADIDVKDGQKVVVGKTGLEGTQRALILVLAGKIVD